MSDDHNKIADKLAKKLKTKHRHEGVDIVTGGKAIEVAVSPEDVRTSVEQLKRSRAGKKYMAVPPVMVKEAKKLLEGTGIGVMTTSGKIRKRSRKKRK